MKLIPNPKGYSSLAVYLRLMRYVKPYLGLFGLSMIGFVLYAVTQPALGQLMELFIDGLNGKKYDLTYLLPSETSRVGAWLIQWPFWTTVLEEAHAVEVAFLIPALVILIYIVRGFGSFLGGYFMARVGFQLVHTLRCQMFDRMIQLPNRYFELNSTGHLISKFTFNVNQVTDAVARASTVAIREGATVIALFVALIYQNWFLTLSFMAIAPILALLVGSAGKRFKKLTRKIQISVGDVAHVTKEVVSSFSVVRSFGGERFESNRFHDASTRNCKQQLRQSRLRETFSPILQFIVALAMAGMMYMTLTLAHGMTAGELVAYVTMAGLLPRPLKQLSGVGAQMQRGIVAAEDVFRLLDQASEKDEGTFQVARAEGNLEIRDLSFRYEGADHDVLHQINLQVKAGEMIALVGQSGSGKTTLVNLIQRFYDVTQGVICIDGIKISDYALRNLRQQIAQVNQNTMLFDDTVANNIAYGMAEKADRKIVERAAEAAFASEFISQLPKGFDTKIGENGSSLSGGQRQRLAIARAIYKDAPILILDEATSALDTESERYIQRALEGLMQGRTTLVIAHRLSTIEKADRIVVMEQGRVVEIGTHAELMASGKSYKKLHDMQFQELA
ncbi:Putative lipid A export ATP-binding/permease protein [gamma proteobacterium HdN1]|nr:Putative lipid A export ATP-binding/permease protein [gamma proteobacterium HdN1]